MIVDYKCVSLSQTRDACAGWLSSKASCRERRLRKVEHRRLYINAERHSSMGERVSRAKLEQLTSVVLCSTEHARNIQTRRRATCCSSAARWRGLRIGFSDSDIMIGVIIAPRCAFMPYGA